MAVNALAAWGLMIRPARKAIVAIAGTLLLALILQNGNRLEPPAAPVQATAVLLQQNLDVNQNNAWRPQEYQEHVDRFVKLSERNCAPYLAGMPQLDRSPCFPRLLDRCRRFRCGFCKWGGRRRD